MSGVAVGRCVRSRLRQTDGRRGLGSDSGTELLLGVPEAGRKDGPCDSSLRAFTGDSDVGSQVQCHPVPTQHLSPCLQAHRIALELAVLPSVESVCLYGSVARGDNTEGSDVDLLVLENDAGIGAARIYELLEPRLQRRLQVRCFDEQRLRDLAEAGALYFVHLQQDAWVLYDRNGVLMSVLSTTTDPQKGVRTTLATARRDAARYRDLSPFAGNHLSVLSHLYAIGRATVMAALVARGEVEFQKDRAFARFGQIYPDRADDVRTLSCLRAFYDLNTGRGSTGLPFLGHKC